MVSAIEALLTLPCQLCFTFVLWRPATGGKTLKEREERKKDGERERKRERDHHHYGQKDISRDMMQSTLNNIPRNPSPPRKKITRKKMFFLIQMS